MQGPLFRYIALKLVKKGWTGPTYAMHRFRRVKKGLEFQYVFVDSEALLGAGEGSDKFPICALYMQCVYISLYIQTYYKGNRWGCQKCVYKLLSRIPGYVS